MTEDEAVHLIVEPMMEKLIDFAAGKNELEEQFERKFEELGEQKARGVRIYYPKNNYFEMIVAFHIASVFSVAALDGGWSRYHRLSKGIGVAMGGILASDDTHDINEVILRYNAKVRLYGDYLNAEFAAGRTHFLSIITKAGVAKPSDPLEEKALAYRLWTLAYLEQVLLGKHYKPERQGELCFMLLDMVNEVARNTERVITEYCGPSPMPAAPVQKGCLLPLVLIFGVIISVTAAVRMLIA